MDFWQFGIYIVILTGATSLVIMTIILLVKKMNQHTPPHNRRKSTPKSTEWAHRPPVENTTVLPTMPLSNTAEQHEPSEKTAELVATSQQSGLEIAEETLLASPLSVQEITEAPQIAGLVEHQTATPESQSMTSISVTETNTVANAGEEDSETTKESETGEDSNNDLLSVFRTEEIQENPVSELSAALPDIEILDLLRESKEVLKILGLKTEIDNM